MRERKMFELHEACEDAEDVAEFAPAFEAAVGGFADIGGKAQAQEIQEVDFTLRRGGGGSRRRSGVYFFVALRSCVRRRALVKSFRKELPVPSGKKAERGAAIGFRLRGKAR